MFQRIALFFLLVLGAAQAQESSTPDYFRANADKLIGTKVFVNVAYAYLSDYVRSDDMSDLRLYCYDKRTGNYNTSFDGLILRDELKTFMKRVGNSLEYKSGEIKTTKISGVLRKSTSGFLFIDLTEREPAAGVKQEPTKSLVILSR